MKIFAVVLFTVFAASFGLDLPGQCPNPGVVQPFNISNYMGLWYEIYRYETDFETGGERVTAQYSPNSGGNVTVLNSMYIDNELVTIEGTAAPATDANGGGKLTVWFATGSNEPSNYWVLATDYLEYSLVYYCTNKLNNTMGVSSWILSRSNYLKPSSVLAIQPTIVAVNGLEWANYRYTNHTNNINNTNNTESSSSSSFSHYYLGSALLLLLSQIYFF